MAEEFTTVAGTVVLEPNGAGRWNVFTKKRSRFLGTVQLVTEDGRYEAAPAGRKAQECANLKAAVQVVGANG